MLHHLQPEPISTRLADKLFEADMRALAERLDAGTLESDRRAVADELARRDKGALPGTNLLAEGETAKAASLKPTHQLRLWLHVLDVETERRGAR